jgi:hypothetical protein
MSYITISKETAEKLANKTLARIVELRAEATEEVIKARYEKICNSFFHKLFKRKAPTREAVIESFEGDLFLSDLQWISIRYSECENVAKKVLMATTHMPACSSDIHITLEDLACIN